MSLGARIKEARRAAGWDQRQLAARVGVTNGAVSQWESDKIAPTFEKLEILGSLFGVSLFDDEVPTRARTSVFKLQTLRGARDLDARPETTLEPTRPSKRTSFAIYMPDRSMEPAIARADLVIVDTGESTRPGDLVVCCGAFGATVRQARYVALDDASLLVLRPANADFPEWRLVGSKAAEITILGVVVEIEKHDRRQPQGRCRPGRDEGGARDQFDDRREVRLPQKLAESGLTAFGQKQALNRIVEERMTSDLSGSRQK